MIPSTAGPRATIIITQRESFVHTRRSLESIYASTRIPFSLVYVDGGSPPRTRAYLERQAKIHGFRLIRRARFLTPNEARNIGFAAVATEFAAFVENDVLVRDGWLEALLAAADREHAAVVGPLIYFREPAFTVIHSAGGTLRFDPTPDGSFYHNIQRFKERSMASMSERLGLTAVDFVEFHCFLARTDTVRTSGPFDEALRSCLEFDDFCLAVKRAGGVIVNEPAAVVQHLLPLAPPLGLGDLRFLRQRWSAADNAASVRHFRQKWNVRDDDPHLPLVAAWCTMRPRSIIEATRTFQFLRRTKHAAKRVLRFAAPRESVAASTNQS